MFGCCRGRLCLSEQCCISSWWQLWLGRLQDEVNNCFVVVDDEAVRFCGQLYHGCFKDRFGSLNGYSMIGHFKTCTVSFFLAEFGTLFCSSYVNCHTKQCFSLRNSQLVKLIFRCTQQLPNLPNCFPCQKFPAPRNFI